VVKGDFDKMVSLRGGAISSVPLKEAMGELHLVDVKTMYDVERYNGRRAILR
jgi:hypothetical protein